MKGMKLLLNSSKKPTISDSLPYLEEPSPCIVVLGSLSAVPLRFQDKSEIQWQEAAPEPEGRYYSPWDETRIGEVHTEPRGACHLSLASSTILSNAFAQGYTS